MKTSITSIRVIAITFCFLLSLVTFAHERDTLRCHFDPSAVFTYTLYPSGNGGYLCGVNGYGDMEIAQKFGQAPVGDTTGNECAIGDEHQLDEVIVYFGAKTTGNPNDSVYINVYDIDHITGAPGALLGSSFPVRMNFIDTSSTVETFTDFLMQLPIVFTDSFFLSVVFPGRAGDTLGVMSSTNGQAQNSNLCWVKDSSGNWSTVSNTHSLDVDAAIFPITGDVTIGINEVQVFVDAVNIFPNPAHERATVEYSLLKPVDHLSFTVLDNTGKIILCLPNINNIPGKHSFSIILNGLTPGSYYYTFASGNKKYNGSLKIVK